jgi:hypothetical protein
MAEKTIIHAFPDGARIVLESAEGAAAYVFQNLYCIRVDGSKIWEAHLPGFPDAFSAARMDQNVLYAKHHERLPFAAEPQYRPRDQSLVYEVGLNL